MDDQVIGKKMKYYERFAIVLMDVMAVCSKDETHKTRSQLCTNSSSEHETMF